MLCDSRETVTQVRVADLNRKTQSLNFQTDLISPQKPLRKILEPELGSGSRAPSPSLTSVGKADSCLHFLGKEKDGSALPAITQKNTSFL